MKDPLARLEGGEKGVVSIHKHHLPLHRIGGDHGTFAEAASEDFQRGRVEGGSWAGRGRVVGGSWALRWMARLSGRAPYTGL